MLDLGLVPREATADLQVITVSQPGHKGSYHRMLLATLAGPALPENGEAWSATETRWAPARTPLADPRC